jgi:hypothetical protein
MKLALVPVLLLAACDAAPPGTLTQPIVNGVVDDADRGVVMLGYNQGTTAQELCSASVVSPHVLLTAAHCTGASFVFTGTMLTNPPPPDEIISIRSFQPNPAYNTDTGDVAVVILNAPTTIPPLPFNHFPLTNAKAGLAGRVAGYGITGGGDNAGVTAGTRRVAPTTLNQVTESDTIILYDKTHSLCFGDSGGPSLFTLDGQEQIAGVAHEAYLGCPVNMGQSDTRVDRSASFVDEWVRHFDPPAVEGGGACTSNADCTPLVCGDSSVGRICQQPCGADGDDACPAGTACHEIDGKKMCASHGIGGCAVAGRDGGAAPLGWLVLMAIGFLARRLLLEGDGGRRISQIERRAGQHRPIRLPDV